MLILQSDITEPTGLAFSPDGLALVAVGENRVQVWPRWLDQPPQPVFDTEATLERSALSPEGRLLFQYVSGISYTRVFTVAKKRDAQFTLPIGPAWFHFTPEGGFFIVCHRRGRLSRFDYAPKEKKRVRKAWTITRTGQDTEGKPAVFGSHYAFGNVCGAAG